MRKVAQDLGYRPNLAAQVTRRGRFGAVSLVLSTDSALSMAGQSFISGILAGLLPQDVHLGIAALPDDALTDSGYVPKILRKLMADGLLLNYNANIPQRMVDLIRASHLPKIWVNSKHPVDCVYPDELGAARKLTEHLLTLGHRRIAFASYTCGTSEQPWHYSGIDRFEGYAQTMRQAGLQPRLLAWETAIPIENQQRLLFSQQWLSQPERPTAVICYTAESASSMILAAVKMGLSLPRQLTVVSYEDRPMNQLGMILSIMLVPEHEMGRLGAQMLLERIDNPDCVLPPRELALEFIAGDTCAPPEST